LRTSLEPVLSDFEDVWSDAWLPRGTEIKFRRSQLLRDDLGTTAVAVSQLRAGTDPVVSKAEARVMLGLPPAVPEDMADDEPPPPPTPPVPPAPPPPDPNAEPDQPPGG
jgi:hypothetical protein